jgi:hypothetical protein
MVSFADSSKPCYPIFKFQKMRDAIAHLFQFVGNDVGVLSILHNMSSSSFHVREVNMFLSRRVALQMWRSL